MLTANNKLFDCGELYTCVVDLYPRRYKTNDRQKNGKLTLNQEFQNPIGNVGIGVISIFFTHIYMRLTLLTFNDNKSRYVMVSSF